MTKILGTVVMSTIEYAMLRGELREAMNAYCMAKETEEKLRKENEELKDRLLLIYQGEKEDLWESFEI